ncbi:hypothetical protein SNE40_021572 [Patella caerulea]|uniref:Uncharacterized protein n=1 Tax=Patella caerulea TaxID=87958 RepID=A0AAN8IWU7_PATCE
MDEQREIPSNDSRRLKPPNRKKYEEELEGYQNKIKDLETQLAAAKSGGNAKELREIRVEKDATFERNKKINSDLKTLNQEISAKTSKVSQMQSGLVYKNEEKHNDAIRKLEWNLAHHSYRLTEERKIVAEIDRLKRSKISLIAYNNAKSQVDELRGKQRRMREERDHYSKTITSLRAQEDDVKRRLSSSRITIDSIKKELDEQYQGKRKLIEDFKRQQTDFQGSQKKRRQESFKKREEERKAILEAKQKEEEELEQMRIPFEDERKLCNTLISYLQGFSYTMTPDTQQPTNEKTQTSTSNIAQNQGCASSGPAEELEDGNLILLRKSDDNDFIIGNVRKANKKSRKYRKASGTKYITHCPQVIGQFSSLNLRAPCSAMEIPASLEQLRARKVFYEQKAETQSNISLTESGICEMSRQASNTESCGSACETRAPEDIMDELLSDKNCCHDFPCVNDSVSQPNDNHSTAGSNTPRNLSISSGSIMSTDVDDIDNNGQSSLENSNGHLSQIDHSDHPSDNFKPIQPEEVLNNNQSCFSSCSQSESVSYISDKAQLNQLVTLNHRENNVVHKAIGNGILAKIYERDETVNKATVCKENVSDDSDANSQSESEQVNILCESLGKANVMSDMNTDKEEEITHL